MGLRLTLIGILSTVLVLSGVGMTGVFRYQLAQEAAAADRSGAQKDMERLLLALNQQIDELNVILGSWSNFTAFYEHAAKPTAVFRNDDLSIESLKTGHFDWLNLINAQGQIVEHSEVPLSDGTTPARAEFQNPAMATAVAEALQVVVQRGKGCAIMGDGNRLAIGCYQPLLTSDAKGPARGTVLIGRWISDDIVARVRSQTNLQFTFTLRAHAQAQPADLSRTTGSFLSASYSLIEGVDSIRVDSQVFGMQGRHIADLHLEWPRESLARMQTTLRLVTVAMAVLILITVLVLVLVCDRLLVRRLQGVRSDLGRILEHESWDGRVQTTRNDELTELARYINGMLDIIRSKISLVQEQALTDPLTGLSNRRRFDMRVQSTLAQLRRDGNSGALVLFDIDYFKRYNDIYGHPQGDAALVQFANCLREAARRPVDMPARLGGEEFAILMPLTDLNGARHCVERARAAMQALGLAHVGNEASGCVTFSAGLTMARADDTEESLYSRADAALYAAKNAGRNRLSVA